LYTGSNKKSTAGVKNINPDKTVVLQGLKRGGGYLADFMGYII